MTTSPSWVTHRPARPGFPLPLVLLLLTVVTAACSSRPDPGPGEEPSVAAGSPTRTPATTAASGEIPVTITIGDTVLTARLADHATAQDLADQLPLTLTFNDFHSVEKIARLPRPLSLDGAPAGADPEVGDLGYYAPSEDLVFYYGDVGYFPGIVRIGRLDSSAELVERQGDRFRATIRRA